MLECSLDGSANSTKSALRVCDVTQSSRLRILGIYIENKNINHLFDKIKNIIYFFSQSALVETAFRALVAARRFKSKYLKSKTNYRW